MDTDGKKGAILERLTNPASAASAFHFFPYFKLLFKLAQIGMTKKTKESLERKQEAMQKEMDAADVHIGTQDALIKNLGMAQTM